jgi:pimeloyl-ACP methyl ester carboxylesterase
VPITDLERDQVAAANASGHIPVVFVHGLWLLPGSWDAWRTLFESKGYAALAPGWPDDPATVKEARDHPEVLAGKSIGQVTDHYAEVIKSLVRKPIVIGHSFGGLITQKIAGADIAAAAVAIDPAPFRGVLPLPFSSLKTASVALKNPANRHRSVMLTYEQFRYGFANAVPEDEAHDLYDTYSVPGPGLPLFQAAFANFNPRTEAAVETKNPNRGPLLLISGDQDHTVPTAITKASYKRYAKSTAPTEFVEIAGRGHSLTIDHGWQEVAETAASFLTRHGLTP